MRFGLEECLKRSIPKSKNITLDINMEITELEPNKTYKY